MHIPANDMPCWPSLPLPHPGNLTSCFGNRMCRCSNITQTADCSGNHGNLTFVPHLQGDFRTLNFSNNKLSEITDVNFFANASGEVRILDLYSNSLTCIVRGAFDRFRKLEKLLLGGNSLTWKGVAAVLSGVTSLLDLDLKCSSLTSIPKDALADVRMSRLRALDVGENNIKSLDLKELQPLRFLKYLYAWKNELENLKSARLPSLVAVKLKNNHLYEFPDTCKAGTDESLFPHLRNLEVEFNNIGNLDKPVCLPNVLSLTLRYNKILTFKTDMFSARRFPSLNSLNVAWVEGRVLALPRFTFNSSALTKLDFSHTNVNFSDRSTVDEDVFGGCNNLGDLILTKNDFSTVSLDRFQKLFQPIASTLKTLHLGECGFVHFSQQYFSRFARLQRLYLYGNGVVHIPDGAFDRMEQLLLLNLDSNRIAVVTEQTFSDDTRKRVVHFDLSGNPFMCTCHLLWFKRWLLQNPGHFTGGTKGYRCANLPHTHVQHFETSEQACLLGEDAAWFTIAISCLLLSFFLVFVVFFRFRWHMRLWFYESCRERSSGKRRKRTKEGSRFQYDAFVAYAKEDVAWIQRELLPVLEGEWGMRLCVHQRDFQLGKHIVDNIADCVNASERVILVFSPHFARSQWCQFELKFCQGNVMERDDVMVLVALRETESRDMTGAMMAVLQTTTYIEWDDDTEARTSFWGRLHLALSD
ncbi:hypothetical protein V1264_023968 [Littorina saxatilis]